MEFKVFNVGQGDNMLIKLDELNFVIIDSYFPDNSPIEEPPCLTHLKNIQAKLIGEKSKIQSIYIILTHFDYDHVKGLRRIFNWIEDNGITIKKMMISPSQRVINTINLTNRLSGKQVINLAPKLLDVLEVIKTRIKKVPFEYITSNTNLFRWDENAEVIAIGPPTPVIERYMHNFDNSTIRTVKQLKKQATVDKNKLSGIFQFSVNGNRILFCGDSDSDTILESRNYVRGTLNTNNYNVIKAPHHGAKGSSTYDFWNDVIQDDKETIVINSAGENNNYKHPHGKTLNDLRLVEKNNINTNITFCCTSSPNFDCPTNQIQERPYEFSQIEEKKIKDLKESVSKFRSQVTEMHNDGEIEKIKTKKRAKTFSINVKLNSQIKLEREVI